MRTLWAGWADWCCEVVVQPSEELLSDLQHLDLVSVAAVNSSIALVCDEPLSMVARPFETIVSWLKSLVCYNICQREFVLC